MLYINSNIFSMKHIYIYNDKAPPLPPPKKKTKKNQNVDSSLHDVVHTTHFWNNLHQVLNVKRLESQISFCEQVTI